MSDAVTPTIQTTRNSRKESVATCTLCAELCLGLPPLHEEMVPDSAPSRILLETANCVAIPSIGPLTTGHLLIAPRHHAVSILTLPEAELLECETLIARCVARLRSLYGDSVIAFEHGTTRAHSESAGTCVEHAHLHLLPGPPEFLSRVVRPGESWERGTTLRDLAQGAAEEEYLLVGRLGSEQEYRLRYGIRSPSQFMRQQYAAFTGISHPWDWRVEASPATFLRTISDWNSG